MKMLKGMTQDCDCQPHPASRTEKREYCDQHVTNFNYKPRRRPRMRAVCDVFAGREVRKFRDVEAWLRRWKTEVDDGVYVSNRRPWHTLVGIESQLATFAEGMDHFIEHRFVGKEVVIVPRGSRKRKDGETYLDWLYAVVSDAIKHTNPDVAMRAEGDRGRLSKPRGLVRFWGARALTSLTLADAAWLKRHLQAPAKFQKHSRSPRLRAVATINDWVSFTNSVIGHLVESGLLKASPFVVNGKAKLNQDSCDNARDRYITNEEMARYILHAPSPFLVEMIQFAHQSMMRKGEQRRLRIEDVGHHFVRVNGSVKQATEFRRAGSRVNKTCKTRQVPITPTMRAIMDAHLTDANGREKGPKEFLFCDGTGARPARDWDYEWIVTRLKAHGYPVRYKNSGGFAAEMSTAIEAIDTRWHDLRAKGITDAIKRGMSPSAAGKAAGNPSCVSRYDRQPDDAIYVHAQQLDVDMQEVVRKLSELKEGEARPASATAA